MEGLDVEGGIFNKVIFIMVRTIFFLPKVFCNWNFKVNLLSTIKNSNKCYASIFLSMYFVPYDLV